MAFNFEDISNSIQNYLSKLKVNNNFNFLDFLQGGGQTRAFTR